MATPRWCDLEAAPVSMTTGTPDAYLKLRDKAMHRLGVGTTHDMTSVITGLFLPSWTFPGGYTLPEKVNLWRGRAFSRSFGLWDQLIRIDLRERVPRLEIPVYFLEGAYDYTCATELARDYFRRLDAPMKGFYEFGDSAHSPVLEEPALAHRILLGDVLAGTNPWLTSSNEQSRATVDRRPIRSSCVGSGSCKQPGGPHPALSARNLGPPPVSAKLAARGDPLAGVTVAAYLVPQVMAYAEVAGLPAITGLWAAIGRWLPMPFSARRASSPSVPSPAPH